jgi:uncharacterized protein YbjT (DUF2867 family)
MAENKTILVVGATGQQGGSVARHLKAQGNFKIRCLTRNPNTEKALALKNAGFEIAVGDLTDISTTRKAVRGCYGVFGVTNFWEHFNKEFEHGMNLLEAVKAEKVEHYVFSSLPNPRKFGDGGLDVPHFELKAKVEEQVRKSGLKFTIIHVAFYFENFLYFFPPQKQGDGSFTFGFPQGDTPLAMVSSQDIGGVVARIFAEPDEFIGKTVGIVGEDRRAQDYAESMSRALNKRIIYNYIPREVFAGFGFPGAEDLANMFEMNRLYIPSRLKDLEESRRLNPQMQSFDSWLAKNKDKFTGVIS